MARINLLPWREELRKERQREFISILAGSLVLTGLIMAYVHMHIAGMIEDQQSRNDFLKSQIQQVEAKIKEIKDLQKNKEQLIARMRVIERLQRNRPEIVHLFDELVKLTPDGLYLTGVTQQGSSLNISGEAQSNARVSALMRNLDQSAWFEQPELEVIQNSAGQPIPSRRFRLSVKQSGGQQEEEDK